MADIKNSIGGAYLMYNIHEIKLQNQQDCISLLYLCLASELLSLCGRRGEEAVQKAVRRYGETRGASARKRLELAGIPANLKNLADGENDCPVDPRFRKAELARTEQVHLWEVYTCPMADLWKRMQGAQIGRLYCDEYCRAFYHGFSDGAAQANITDMLTCPRNNHCRFSVYYRPSNIEEPSRIFSSLDTRTPELTEPIWSVGGNESGSFGRLWFLLFHCMAAQAEELLENEGLSAVALGLRRLAREQAAELRRHAADTKTSLTDKFLAENFPISIRSGGETEKELCSEKESRLLQANFYSVLERELNVE